jgi:hypothetical protein
MAKPVSEPKGPRSIIKFLRELVTDASRLANCLEVTLADLKVPRELIAEVLQTVDGLREQVLNR